MGRRMIDKAPAPALILALQAAALLLLFSCDLTNPIDEVIREAEQKVLEGERPVVSLFEIVGGPSVINNPAVALNLQGSDNVVGWLVNETSTEPALDDTGWAEAVPTAYTFSAVPGSRTLYAWAKNDGGLRNTPVSLTVTLQEPAPSASNADDSVITAHESIVFNFGEDMDTATCVISGTMGGGSAAAEWSSDKKTLTLNASNEVAWSAGSSRTLIVNCENQYGLPCNELSLSYDVFNGVCVAPPSAGNDSLALGTVTDPLATIDNGIALANTLYITGEGLSAAQVRVAQGDYVVDWAGDAANRIVMVEGISLYGGYNTVDWETRDANECTITDTSGSSPVDEWDDAYAAVRIGSGITSATALDGFRIIGSDNPNNVAVFCLDSSPVISGCIIRSAGNGTDAFRVALLVNTTGATAANPTIENCDIAAVGGADVQWGVGILIYNSSATVLNCVISGGQTQNNPSGLIETYSPGLQIGSSGINAEDDGSEALELVVMYNTIIAGTSTSGCTTGILCSQNNGSSTASVSSNLITVGGYKEQYPVYLASVAGTESFIRNNTMVGNLVGYLPPLYYILLNDAGTVSIDNNIFVSRAVGGYVGPVHGVYDNAGGSADVTSMQNNDFHDLSDVADTFSVSNTSTWSFGVIGGTTYQNLTTLNATAWAGGNISIDPLFSDPDNEEFRLTSGSPDTVSEAGLNGEEQSPAWDFTLDADGNGRTGDGSTGTGATGWSMGAYEQD